MCTQNRVAEPQGYYNNLVESKFRGSLQQAKRINIVPIFSVEETNTTLYQMTTDFFTACR